MACRLVRVFVWERASAVWRFADFCRRHGVSAHPTGDSEVMRTLPKAWTSDAGGALFELSMRAVELEAVLQVGAQPSLDYVLGVGEWPCFVFTRRNSDDEDVDNAYSPLLSIVPIAPEPCSVELRSEHAVTCDVNRLREMVQTFSNAGRHSR